MKSTNGFASIDSLAAAARGGYSRDHGEMTQ
jgi:hypothetical protein